MLLSSTLSPQSNAIFAVLVKVNPNLIFEVFEKISRNYIDCVMLAFQTSAVENKGTAVDVGASPPRDNAQFQVGSSPIGSAVPSTLPAVDTDAVTKLH